MVTAKPREIAYFALRRAAAPGDFVEHRLESDPGFLALRPDDRRLAQELVYGALRRRATLDWLLDRRTGARRQRPEIRTLLHLGLYQLLFLDRIPPHAAVHETVQLAREHGMASQSGFVNAVLRGTLRDLPATRAELAVLAQTDPATATSHPAWLVDRWQARLGKADTAKLLELNNTPPPTFARVNSLRTDPETLQRTWGDEGVVAVARDFSWTGPDRFFELQDHPPLTTLPSFQRGEFYVQDPSTLLAVTLLDPHPGDAVLDRCAAPGGKTLAIAGRMGNQGRLVAEDGNDGRLRLLGENVTRMGATCVTITTTAEGPAEGLFDRVLVDAPCSNTGVLRRRLESRWRLEPAALGRLERAQLTLLRAVASRVKLGGLLVYSTCSLEPEENTALVDQFLAAERSYSLETTQQVLPWRDGVDGAFAAALRRGAT